MTMAATDHPSGEGVNNEKEVPNHQSRRRANENIDWQNESTFMTRDIEEEDFQFWIASNIHICKAVAKEHILLLCDIANVACALLFQIILLSVGNESGTFVFATPFYSVHIMLNVKKKSMLSSSNNSNNDDGGDNDDETKYNNDDDVIPFSVPFVKMVACVWAMWIIRSIIVWSIYNTEEEFMESICWAVWTTGCIFNLRLLTHDMKSLRAVSHRQIRPLFHTFSLPVGWVANFLCLIGVVFGGIGSGLDPDAGPCILPIVLLCMGLAFYIIHSILFGLSICFGHILYEYFSDENLLAVLRSRGENNGDDNGDDDDVCRRMRKDDILKIQCLFLMPIFILVGTQSTGGREIYKPIPIMATIMGGVLYLSYTILDMRKRKANGASSDITKIGMCGGIMWCIGSLLFCCLVADQWGVPTRVIGIFWMIGCFCNLFVITSDLSELSGRDGQARPLFKILFVWTSLATNILNAIGAGFIVSDISFNIGGVLLTCGFVLFFVQPFLLALSIIYGHVVFLIHISTPTPGSSGDQRGGMEDCVIPLLDKKNDTSCDTTTTVV